ncbi:TIR domain-containing protein [Photobacterium damselae]|uniref:TIR domain-containing protein n=1 Tax=Photobacterium damselae TaxID=38293 RepID=UPI00370C4A94
MARKTFISYKYSEAQKLRDKILKSLGDDAIYYQGETADSPDLTDTTTENIKKNLTDMMYNTSVTIVILSPNIKKSDWIDWEIEYCLKEISRNGRTSKTNGIVGVVQEVDGSYDWLVTQQTNYDGCVSRVISDDPLLDIIKNNRYNKLNYKHTCEDCKTFSQLDGSYISIVEENVFLKDPHKYIENAYSKSENAKNFKLVKKRNVTTA